MFCCLDGKSSHSTLGTEILQCICGEMVGNFTKNRNGEFFEAGIKLTELNDHEGSYVEYVLKGGVDFRYWLINESYF